MFLNRKNLNVWQMMIVIIFLIFMLLNPVALNANKTQEFKLDGIMPNLMNQVDKMAVEDLNTIEIVQGELKSTNQKLESSGMYLNESDNNFSEIETGLNFTKDQLIMKDKNGLKFNLRYTTDWNSSEWDSVESFKTWLTKEWNYQNTPYRIMSMTLLVSILVFSSTLFLVFGAAFFIWLTKKNHLSSIRSFKESVNLVLNAMFLSHLIAMVAGLIYYDITLILTIQSFGLAIQLLIIFAKTKFNDGLAKEGKIVIDK
jgi:maltodextrin utilization protein YvdJ